MLNALFKTRNAVNFRMAYPNRRGRSLLTHPPFHPFDEEIEGMKTLLPTSGPSTPTDVDRSTS